jgi:hypothetical protein
MLWNNYSYELATLITWSEPNRALGPSRSTIKSEACYQYWQNFHHTKKIASEIPTELLQIYLNSMKNRCRGVIAA